MRSKLLLCLSVLLLFGCTKKNENVESKRQNSINVDDLINAIKKDPHLMDQLVKAIS